ncbi:hypothetical protein HK104_009000 [Borealophlyctis nickersoniae]|nr:hypothetical protein HK104_009000 [Borealophlyctis nickersoniae]
MSTCSAIAQPGSTTTSTLAEQEPITDPPTLPCRPACYRGVRVHEVLFRGSPVMRRVTDGWVNATGLLTAAGFDKNGRERILKSEVWNKEGRFQNVRLGDKGRAHLAYDGTWIPYSDARVLAAKYGVLSKFPTLLGPNDIEIPSKPAYSETIRENEYDGVDKEDADADANIALINISSETSESSEDDEKEAPGEESPGPKKTVHKSSVETLSPPPVEEDAVPVPDESHEDQAVVESRILRRAKLISDPTKVDIVPSASADHAKDEVKDVEDCNSAPHTPTSTGPIEDEGVTAPASPASTAQVPDTTQVARTTVSPSPSPTPSPITHPFLTITDQHTPLPDVAPKFHSFLLAIPNGVATTLSDAERRTTVCLERIKKTWDAIDLRHWDKLCVAVGSPNAGNTSNGTVSSNDGTANVPTDPGTGNTSATEEGSTAPATRTRKPTPPILMTATRPSVVARNACADRTARALVTLRRCLVKGETDVLRSIVDRAVIAAAQEAAKAKEEVGSLKTKLAKLETGAVKTPRGALKQEKGKVEELTAEVDRLRKEVVEVKAREKLMLLQRGATEDTSGDIDANLDRIVLLESSLAEARQREDKSTLQLAELQKRIAELTSQVGKSARGRKKRAEIEEKEKLVRDLEECKERIAEFESNEEVREDSARQMEDKFHHEVASLRAKVKADEVELAQERSLRMEKQKLLEAAEKKVQQLERQIGGHLCAAVSAADDKEDSEASEAERDSSTRKHPRLAAHDSASRTAALQAEVVELVKRLADERRRREETEEESLCIHRMAEILAELIVKGDDHRRPTELTREETEEYVEKAKTLLEEVRKGVNAERAHNEAARKAAETAAEVKEKRRKRKANAAGPSTASNQATSPATSNVEPAKPESSAAGGAEPAADKIVKRRRVIKSAKDKHPATALPPADAAVVAQTEPVKASRKKTKAKEPVQPATPPEPVPENGFQVLQQQIQALQAQLTSISTIATQQRVALPVATPTPTPTTTTTTTPPAPKPTPAVTHSASTAPTADSPDDSSSQSDSDTNPDQSVPTRTTRKRKTDPTPPQPAPKPKRVRRAPASTASSTAAAAGELLGMFASLIQSAGLAGKK